MIKVTGIYTNWRRKENLWEILKSAKAQSVHIDLWLVDNAANTEHELRVSGVRRFEHDNSEMCWQRWRYAVIAPTPYVYVMDDDLIFTTPTEIEKCVAWMDKHPELDCVGYTGVKYKGSYFGSPHYMKVSELTEVDIVKGRFMFIRTSSLKGLDMTPDLTCDDIKVSAHLKNKALLPLSFANLAEGSEAVFLQKGQKEKREHAAKRYL